MKYFIDTEFIESFHKPFLGKRRHFIDLISIGIVCEDGREFYAISSEYDYNDADDWVKQNVIMPLYISTVHGDMRNQCTAENFQNIFGQSISGIANQIKEFCKNPFAQPSSIEFVGYYADYDWVLFCSLFGRMIDLPEGFPMYCLDLKQMMHENNLSKEWKRRNCPDPEGEHDALIDARWNKLLYEKIILNNHQNVQVSDTTDYDSSNDAGNQTNPQ